MSETPTYATLDQLTDATQQQRREEDVYLPVSELTVRIRELSERERTEIETEQYSRDGSSQIRQRLADVGLRLIQRCLINPRIERSHIGMLSELSSTDANVLKDACTKLCGFTEADRRALDLEGKLETSTGSN